MQADLQQLSEINATKKEPLKISQRNKAQNSSVFSCDECDKQYCDRSGLFYHKKSVHEGLKYPCDQCNYKATNKSSLLQHIKSIHEGVKYPCNQCNHTATFKSGLQRHIKSAHEGGQIFK